MISQVNILHSNVLGEVVEEHHLVAVEEHFQEVGEEPIQEVVVEGRCLPRIVEEEH